ncbi:MAG: hypothetical protein ACD_61C00252G0003 [uncultured bacterium]|nr:MAG: hypothetical protein ACD_61C00252G0003 [uncultured bacterium]
MIFKFDGVKEIGIAGVISQSLIGSGHTKGFGSFRQHFGSFPHQIVTVVAMVPDTRLDVYLFGDGEIFFFHQLVDVELDRHRRGNPTGGSMWLGEKSFFFQNGHFISEGGGRDPETILVFKSHRADGFGRQSELLNNGFDDMNLSFGKIH